MQNKNLEIEKRVCRLACGSENGTAFLLSSELAITATHCTGEYSETVPIVLEFRKLSSTPILIFATPMHTVDGHTFPVILLRLTDRVPIENTQLAVKALLPLMNIEIFGYPQFARDNGNWLIGTTSSVIRPNQVHSGDPDIEITPKGQFTDFKGYSGSPLLQDDNIVGIVLSQTAHNEHAVLISAISIAEIKSYLSAHGIECVEGIETDILADAKQVNLFAKTTSVTTVLAEIGKYAIQNAEQSVQISSLTNEKIALIDCDLNEIVNAQIDGDEKAGLERLRGIVDDEIHRYDSAYYRFFNLAAQLLFESDSVLAAKYSAISKRLKPDCDDRIYRALAFANDEQFTEAEAILTPIDSTAIMSHKLILRYAQNMGSSIDDIISQSQDVKRDISVYNALALCYLQARDFDNAIKNAILMTEEHPKSSLCWHVYGAILYWQSLPKFINAQPSASLFVFARKLQLTVVQCAGMRNALKYFLNAKQYAELYDNNQWRIIATTDCLIAAWTLSDDSATALANELLALDNANIAALIYLFISGREIPEVNEKSLLERVTSGEGSTDDVLMGSRIMRMAGRYDEAQDLLYRYKSKFAVNTSAYFNYIDEEIVLEVIRGKLKNAKTIAQNALISDAERKRILLFISQHNNNSTPQSQIKLAAEIKRQYGEDLDYQNLCSCYHQYHKWRELLITARDWYRKYENPAALVYKLEALYYNKKTGNAEKCLSLLDEIELLIGLEIRQKRIKISCLSALSKFEEALAIINEIGLSGSDESLVIEYSNIELSRGEYRNAINVLKAYIDTFPDSIKASTLLVSYLNIYDKQDALKYAKQIADLHPNNYQLRLTEMNIAFNTGHDEYANSIFVGLQNANVDPKIMRTVSISEIVDVIRAQWEVFEEYDKFFHEAKIPIHLLFDYNNSTLAFWIFQNWNNDERGAMWYNFGVRADIADTDILSGFKEIVMDYTSILTAHCLGLLNIIAEHFDCILISPLLFPRIADELDKLNYQESVKKKTEKLLLIIDNQKLMKIIPPPGNIENPSDVQLSDLKLYLSASSVGALAVIDSFATEKLNGRSVPREYREIQIQEADLLGFLHQSGRIAFSPDPQSIHEENISKLNIGAKLLINQLIIEKINNLIDFDDFANMFELYFLEDEANQIKAQNMAFIQQDRCKEWLLELQQVLQKLVEQKKIVFCERNQAISEVDTSLRYLLENAMLSAKKKQIPLWVDDRFMNSYPNIGKAPIVGIMDVLHTLNCNKTINKAACFGYIKQLQKHDYHYCVPPAEYVFDCLSSSGVLGTLLIENSALKGIRRNNDTALYANSRIGTEQLSGKKHSEVLGYLLNLADCSRRTISMIWSDTGKDINWKIAATDWISLYYSDNPCDSTLFDNGELIEKIAIKHLSMIFTIVFIPQADQLYYANWLFPHLYLYWQFNPDDKILVVHRIAETCNHEEDKNLRLMKLLWLSRIIPTDIFTMIVSDPIFNGEYIDDFEIEGELISYPIISDIKPKTTEINTLYTGDLFEKVKEKETDWKMLMDSVIAESINMKPVDAILKFANTAIDKFGIDYITQEFCHLLASMIWYTEPEQRIEVQELRRRLSVE